jgi:transposase-like protein
MMLTCSMSAHPPFEPLPDAALPQPGVAPHRPSPQTVRYDSASALIAVIELARAVRLEETGNRCPRCGHEHTVAHGSFSGRQRRLCYGCRRTFSDFTGTPMAYCKRTDCWLLYAACMVASKTVRASAAIAGVSPRTSFRWRHRVLTPVNRLDLQPLSGRVGVAELVVRYSEKGARAIGRQPRRRGGGVASLRDGVIVLFARAPGGPLRPVLAGARQVNAEMLRRALRPHLANDATVVANAGRYSAFAAFCRSVGLRFRQAGRTAVVRLGAKAFMAAIAGRAAFCVWVERFRGVATRYLANYLQWLRFLHAPVAGGCGPPGGTGLTRESLIGAFASD